MAERPSDRAIAQAFVIESECRDLDDVRASLFVEHVLGRARTLDAAPINPPESDSKLIDAAPADPVVSAECWRRAVNELAGKLSAGSVSNRDIRSTTTENGRSTEHANSPRSKAVADDLVQRALVEVAMLVAVKGRAPEASDVVILRECADALARKDAEIAELQAEQRNILSSSCDANDEVERLRKMNEGLRDQHATDSVTLRNLCAARDTLRQRAEARAREALSLLGEARNYLEGLDITDTIDALVLLDTEEAK